MVNAILIMYVHMFDEKLFEVILLKSLKKLIISLVISVGVGLLSGFLTKDSMEIFERLTKPPLSPPGSVFPIVWSILFVLMGISAYLIWISDAPKQKKQTAFAFYGAQLALNFFWSIIFRKLQVQVGHPG